MRRDKEHLFQAEIVLPVQFFESARARALRHNGECQLLAAVLAEAIDCYRKNCDTHDSRKQKLFQEAEHWIMRKGDAFVFSFEHICGVLGIDPASLRQGLQRWRSGKTGAADIAAADPVSGDVDATARAHHCADLRC
ncbi:MAG: hypothetical protein U0587_02760 [Candidatus Binatia bacterium]